MTVKGESMNREFKTGSKESYVWWKKRNCCTYEQ
jgi:hypothetical protein